ncbi:MAG: DUF2442 domain-containing protein [Bacteriovoracales bacterium]|nr:DUF2442 domain-containing protein [Bacteriovoracales bacterium]
MMDLEGEIQATKVWFEKFTIHVELADGRVISVPLAFYPSLLDASKEERDNFELSCGGTGIHFPLLDMDISVDGLLLGRKENIPPSKISRAS